MQKISPVWDRNWKWILVHLSPKLESQSVKILFSHLYVLHLYPLPLTSARLALSFAHLSFALAFACISLGPASLTYVVHPSRLKQIADSSLAVGQIPTRGPQLYTDQPWDLPTTQWHQNFPSPQGSPGSQLMASGSSL